MNHVQNHFVIDSPPAPAWESRAMGVRQYGGVEGKRPKTYDPGSKLMPAGILRPSSRASKLAAHSAFLMYRSCALPPVPGTLSSAEGRIAAQIRPISGQPYVPLICNPANVHRQGFRVPALRKAVTVNRILHTKPTDFIVHSQDIHPSAAVRKDAKADRNRPFLHMPAPRPAAASR
jgi:hypothetical protein